LAAALRLLRPGGILAFDNALLAGDGITAAHSDPDRASAGELRELVFGNENLVPMLLPTIDGLLAAVKRAS
ncbi:MAG TPA: methyltransferase, partial [Streptosporangiaceae bacterium]|nr:methyltransferase [Streptosporangiaceae bacterium]